MIDAELLRGDRLPVGKSEWDAWSFAISQRFDQQERASIENDGSLAETSSFIASHADQLAEVAVLWDGGPVQHLVNLVKIVELRVLPYEEYLQSEHWKRLRKKVFQAAGNRCQVCNSEGRLEAHHRSYDRRGFEDLSDLIALCPKCHTLFHEHLALAIKEAGEKRRGT